MRLFSILAYCAGCAFLTGAALAQSHSHTHGEASLTIAIEGQSLRVGFTASGADVVGFEHPPITAEQISLLETATETINDLASIVRFDQRFECVEQSADIHTEGFEDTGHDHAGFEGQYQLVCAASPDALVVTAFDAFPAIQHIDVQIIGLESPIAEELGPSNRNLSW